MANELTTTGGGLSVVSRISEFQQVAKLFQASGMFSDAKSEAQCFVKIMAGAELGIPPFTAMNAFHVIQGKPVMSANTIAARLKASGRYNYVITEKTAARCSIDFYENGKKVYTETWDTQRAQKAGVKNMDRFPDAMLFARAITAGARAITAGARAVAPDVVGQFYTPDEMGADVDMDGNIVEGSFKPAEQKPEPPHADAVIEAGAVRPPSNTAAVEAYQAAAKAAKARGIDVAPHKATITNTPEQVAAKTAALNKLVAEFDAMADAATKMGGAVKVEQPELIPNGVKRFDN
jgi:hypothetical protein